jgi:hypothetical protein
MSYKKSSAQLDQAERDAANRLFSHRVINAKLDLAANTDLISGLFESSGWSFVCFQHQQARFVDEKALKKHFEEENHKRRSASRF